MQDIKVLYNVKMIFFIFSFPVFIWFMAFNIIYTFIYIHKSYFNKSDKELKII